MQGPGDNLYDQHNAVIFRRMQKSPSLLTDQDQQTGASNFVNIDFAELCHIFLTTWHSMEYLIQNAENLRFKSPLLPDQSIWHLCLPTKKSGPKKARKRLIRLAFCQAYLYRLVIMEVPPRFELGNRGFADPCLTTWLWYHIRKGVHAVLLFTLERVTRLELATSTLARWRSTR